MGLGGVKMGMEGRGEDGEGMERSWKWSWEGG